MRIEESIGSRIRAERERQGMTLESLGAELAQYLGKAWTPQAIWQAERGQRDFRAAQLLAFALALEVPVVQLLAPYPGEAEPISLSEGFSLDDEATDRLFMAVGTPGVGPALLDVELEMESVANALMLAGKAQLEAGEAHQAMAQRVWRTSDVLMGMVGQAAHSPKVKARLKRVQQRRGAD